MPPEPEWITEERITDSHMYALTGERRPNLDIILSEDDATEDYDLDLLLDEDDVSETHSLHSLISAEHESSRREEDPFIPSMEYVNDLGKNIYTPIGYRLKNRLSSFKLDTLFDSLSRISYVDYLTTKNRLARILIHEELTRRGIAPIWRPYPLVALKPPDERKERFFRDSQIIDLYWIWKIWNGHKIDSGRFPDLADLFCDEHFDYRKAEVVAASKLKYNTKVSSLRIPVCTQLELIALRNTTIKKRMNRMKKRRATVRDQLELAILNNGRRKTSGLDLDEWMRCWSALHLADESPTRAVEIANRMPGSPISLNRMKGVKRSLRNALRPGRSYAH